MSTESATANSRAITAIILAGGKSTRFGSDKASALLGGRPLLQWVADAASALCGEIVVVRADGQELPPITTAARLAIVTDMVAQRGPVVALLSGLRAVATPYVFATSCDAPLLQPALIELLIAAADGRDAAIPEVDGFPQPLVAVYRAAALLPALEHTLASPRASLRNAIAALNTVSIAEPQLRHADRRLDSFRNANRPEILAAMEEELANERALAAIQNPKSPIQNHAG